MFTKEEAKAIKTEFWTAFGVYMRKHQSQSGKKIKWVNYLTGVKDIYFRLYADRNEAKVSIDLQHRNEGIRTLFFEQFKSLEHLLPEPFKSNALWLSHAEHPTKGQFSAIFVSIDQVNIYRKDDWSKMFLFYETNILCLDEFWSEFSEIFVDLSS